MRWTTFLVALLVMTLVSSRASASQAANGMTTAIYTASPVQTVMGLEFDPLAVTAQMESRASGQQHLDGFGTLLAINGTGTPVARVLNYQLGDVVQSSDRLDGLDIPSVPDAMLHVGTPAILHDLRIVAVNVQPVMRDADGVARVVTRVDVEVATTGAGGENTKANPTAFSQAFYPLYQASVANLDDLYPDLRVQPPGRIIIVAPTHTVVSDLPNIPQWQKWLDMKKEKGYSVEVASLNHIYQVVNDSTKTGVHNYFAQAYNDHSQPDLEYAILLGDIDGLISLQSAELRNPEAGGVTQLGDNYMATIDGDDYIPDILIARVSVNTTNHIANYFNKVYQYETNPYVADMHWFESTTFIAGNFDDLGHFPVTPVWNMVWTRERMMRDGCITDADTFFYHGPSDPPTGNYRTQIRADMEAGVCAVFYRGWAAEPGWQYPAFDNSDLIPPPPDPEINIGRRNPAVFGVVCGSGKFDYAGNCFGETWTRGVGTPLSPNGAITFFGATDLSTNTRHNNALLAGIVEGLRVTGLRSTGALTMAGKLEVYRQFPDDRDNDYVHYFAFHTYNILGDPETPLYICRPNSFTVTAPPQVNPGSTLINIQSGGVGNAVVSARVKGSDEVHAVMTDASGNAWVPANIPDGADSLQVVVWKAGFFAHYFAIPVAAAPFDPKITGISWQGGLSNLPNPGVPAQFTLTVQNHGTAATDLSCTVTTTDPRITIGTGTATFGNIDPGQSATSSPLSITIGNGFMDGESPILNVAFSGGGSITRQMTFPVAAPNPLPISYVVNDGGNGYLDPGETAPITVSIMNIGHEAGTNLWAHVSSWDNSVTFPHDTVRWASVGIGEQAVSSSDFTVTLANGVTPGRQIQLRYTVYSNGAEIGTQYQWLTAGHVTTTAPYGPDAYGYYAYENIDAGYASTPTYNWIELDPAHGGSGADAHDVHDDSHFAMRLPATYHYYGLPFDSTWICSNGWLSFERASVPEFRNWQMPSPMGPPSLVAGFWDDLVGKRMSPVADTVFTIWTRYDQAENRFVVEWRCFNRRGLADGPGVPNNTPCNFEIILEYNGNTDGNILMQYETISDIDNQNNYGTVGIEDSYHERGMTVVYADRYPAACDTLVAGRAIRFTRTPPDNFLGVGPQSSTIPLTFALHTAYPNPFNPQTELKFDLPKAGNVSLRIFDLLGREVGVLADGFRNAGSYQVSFNGRDLASGLYFARLEASGNTQVQKLMLLK